MIGLQCNKILESGNICGNFRQLEILVNCSRCTQECCTHKSIWKFHIFHARSLYDGFKIVSNEKNLPPDPSILGIGSKVYDVSQIPPMEAFILDFSPHEVICQTSGVTNVKPNFLSVNNRFPFFVLAKSLIEMKIIILLPEQMCQ